MTASTPMLVTFVVYIAAMVLIGLIAYLRTKNLSDYILGGRSLGSFVTALSAGASDMSGWLLMGLPGAIFVAGISESWIAIGLVIGAYLNWLFVAGRLRVQTEHNGNALTLPDFFAKRFREKAPLLRVISAVPWLPPVSRYAVSSFTKPGSWTGCPFLPRPRSSPALSKQRSFSLPKRREPLLGW